jgi:opacity protein-like surface antigen
MKKILLSLIAFIAVFAITIQNATSQTDSCIIKLKNANTGFEQGDYDGTIKLLRSTLSECNLDKSDKIQANKLLIMSYLKVDNLEEADKTAAEIMKIDPYFKPDKFKDDPKLSTLFEKYKPTPMFKIGISGGINFSKTDAVKTFSIVHADDATGLAKYNNKLGFQLGASAEYRAYKDLWVELGFQYRQSKYEHILDSVESTTINYSEKLSCFDVPLSAKYYFLNGSIHPFVEGGVDFSFLSSAISTTTRDDLKDLVDRADSRNKFMAGYFGGAGVVYTIKGLQLFADLRYIYFPDNINKEGTRYSDPVNVFKYYYIDDDFRMDNFQVNVGVSYVLSYKNAIEK